MELEEAARPATHTLLFMAYLEGAPPKGVCPSACAIRLAGEVGPGEGWHVGQIPPTAQGLQAPSPSWASALAAFQGPQGRVRGPAPPC